MSTDKINVFVSWDLFYIYLLHITYNYRRLLPCSIFKTVNVAHVYEHMYTLS
jgi:hypothetical protein